MLSQCFKPCWINILLLPWQFFYNMNFDLNHLHRHVDVIMQLLRFAEKSLLKKKVYDFGKLISEGKLKKYIYADIDYLCNRELIDNDVVYDILNKHMRGKVDFSRLIGSLTTAGLFIEKAF